jgi:hypothetical protein
MLSQHEVHDPLLLALGRLGGAPTKQEALVVVEEQIRERLSPDDWAPVGNGEPHWQNDTAWERNRLVTSGLVLNARRNEWRLSDAGWAEYTRLEVIAHASHEPIDTERSPTGHFKPKDDTEYVARMAKTVLVKSRSHETLVNNFAAWATKKGFHVSNPNNQDLLLETTGRKWIVEAKVLYRGDAMSAARDALSQLFDYRYFLHDDDLSVGLVALFSESIGDAYAGLLTARGIEPVWHEPGKYHSRFPAADSILKVAP